MKLLINTLFVVFSMSICFGQINQVDAKGKKQGPWEKTYPDSKVYMYKGQFKNDRPVGKFVYFYPSSKVKAVINHDVTTGRSEAYYYHENQALMSFGIYRNLKKDSIWTNFGPSGRLSNKETYKNDSLDGAKVIYYVPEDLNDKSKVPSAVMMYKNGALHGEYKEYFMSNTLKMKGMYENGKKVGPWEEFHPNGKRSILYRYKDGVKHGWAIAYDTNMKRIGEQYYYHGRRLEGRELSDKLSQMEKLGINPDE
jgi:antitoxin component YwqK of YwqJK toxin-antitoxin module